MSTPEGDAVRAARSSALPYPVVVAVAAASVASLITGMVASPAVAPFVAGRSRLGGASLETSR